MPHALSTVRSLWFCGLLFVFSTVRADSFEAKPYALVNPVAGSAKLQLDHQGVALLNSIVGPIAPIVVIGPYRSGKSFLLNQLLGVHCDQGFGVGHTRDTQTKGVWIWGQVKRTSLSDATSVSVVFVDTEGFEATGKSNSYDDRIFALSAVLSSLLIYNLPEAIRESDIEKLSFAEELAQGFYSRAEGSHGHALEPGNMLWLIQRDFLQGKSASDVVQAALAPVDNPKGDKDIASLNAIRQSLTSIARNSSGYSLRQPHLDRTRLCEMTDDQLDPEYVRQRDRLKQLVFELATPKVVSGRHVSGGELATLLGRLVGALNAQDIPNVASLLTAFNSDLLQRCIKGHRAALDKMKLPLDEKELEHAQDLAEVDALRLFDEQLLGVHKDNSLRDELLAQMSRDSSNQVLANKARSAELCGTVELQCEATLDRLAAMALPSLRRFEDGATACHRQLTKECVGPSKVEMMERLVKAEDRARSSFMRGYNDRLYTGLVVLSLAAVVVFRFLVKSQLLEALGWVTFAFLQVYPRVSGAVGGGLYESGPWKVLVQFWEILTLLLFTLPAAPFAWAVLLGAAYLWRRSKLAARKMTRRWRSFDENGVRGRRSSEEEKDPEV